MMKNLAGNADADEFIKKELERARIPVKQIDQTDGEVPYSLIGRLGIFWFRRAWYYWVIEGLVPIEVAEELYADPVGKTDIRVNGYAGGAPPEDWAISLTEDGAKVFPVAQESQYCQIEKDIAPRKLYDQEPVFSDDPEAVGAKQYVTVYHIDTEVGLRVFVDTLRAHGLVPESEPAPA